MSKETWGDIPGYEGFYQICKETQQLRSLTRVCKRSCNGNPTRLGQLMSIKREDDNRLRVHLSRDGKQRGFLVHRLMWITFVGPIPDGYEINHKNGKPWDNDLNNLEVVTRLGNMQHAKRHGLMNCGRGERQGSAKLTAEKVVEIRNLYKTGDYSYQELANQFGIDLSHVGNIVKRYSWRHIP